MLTAPGTRLGAKDVSPPGAMSTNATRAFRQRADGRIQTLDLQPHVRHPYGESVEDLLFPSVPVAPADTKPSAGPPVSPVCPACPHAGIVSRASPSANASARVVTATTVYPRASWPISLFEFVLARN